MIFFHILGISSSLLTKSIIFQRGWRKTTNQPQKNDLTINDGQPEKYMSLTSMLQSPCWSTHLDDWVHLVRSRELAIGREQEIHHFPPFFTRKKRALFRCGIFFRYISLFQIMQGTCGIHAGYSNSDFQLYRGPVDDFLDDLNEFDDASTVFDSDEAAFLPGCNTHLPLRSLMMVGWP